MPNDSSAPSSQKLYFRIGEVAQLVGVEPHVLRYWEREFRVIRPSKSPKGQRVYSRRDVDNLLRVRDLLYAQGFTIAGARKRLQQPGEDAEAASPERLTCVKQAPFSSGLLHASPPEPSHGASSPPLHGPVPMPRHVPSDVPRHVPSDVPSHVPPHVKERLLAIRAEVAALLCDLHAGKNQGPEGPR